MKPFKHYWELTSFLAAAASCTLMACVTCDRCHRQERVEQAEAAPKSSDGDASGAIVFEGGSLSMPSGYTLIIDGQILSKTTLIQVTPEERKAMKESSLVVCPECKRKGLKSTVHVGPCHTNAVYCDPGYFDQEGHFQNRPCPDQSSCSYTCSHGHAWGM